MYVIGRIVLLVNGQGWKNELLSRATCVHVAFTFEPATSQGRKLQLSLPRGVYHSEETPSSGVLLVIAPSSEQNVVGSMGLIDGIMASSFVAAQWPHSSPILSSSVSRAGKFAARDSPPCDNVSSKYRLYCGG